MKLAMMGRDGKVRFVQGVCEVWIGPKTPGEFGVSVHTGSGSAGFIFDAQELREFVAAAQKQIEAEDS